MANRPEIIKEKPSNPAQSHSHPQRGHDRGDFAGLIGLRRLPRCDCDDPGLPRGVRKHGRLHRLHMAQSSCRGANKFPDIDIDNISIVGRSSPILASCSLHALTRSTATDASLVADTAGKSLCGNDFSIPSSLPTWEHCNSTPIRINATGVVKIMPATHTGPHSWVSGTT